MFGRGVRVGVLFLVLVLVLVPLLVLLLVLVWARARPIVVAVRNPGLFFLFRTDSGPDF